MLVPSRQKAAEAFIDLNDRRFDRKETPPPPFNDPTQSDCLLVGCGDCRTLVLDEQRRALVALLRERGILQGILGEWWNRYVLPGGAVNLSKRFPRAKHHRKIVDFFVQHQMKRSETIICLVHASCGWVQTHHPGMSFKKVVKLAIKGAKKCQRKLQRRGKAVRMVVIADFLGEPSVRYKLCADLPAR